MEGEGIQFDKHGDTIRFSFYRHIFFSFKHCCSGSNFRILPILLLGFDPYAGGSSDVLPLGVPVSFLKDVIASIYVHDAVLQMELPAVSASGNLCRMQITQMSKTIQFLFLHERNRQIALEPEVIVANKES